MKGRTLLIVAVVVLVVVGAAAAYVFRPVPEPSEPTAGAPMEEPEETMDEATPTTAEEAMVEEDMAGGSGVYVIAQGQSRATFTIDEVLSGVPTTVVGTTDQVAGEIHMDGGNPAASQLGVITINARTLATDSEFRNRAINNEILDVGDFEFITFTPTAVEGLPAEVTVGQSYSFNVTGDLTIRDITRSETFAVTATLVSETQLEGHGETTVLRSNYDLTIPSVPQVADVTDEVLLAIDFVAVAQ